MFKSNSFLGSFQSISKVLLTFSLGMYAGIGELFENATCFMLFFIFAFMFIYVSNMNMTHVRGTRCESGKA